MSEPACRSLDAGQSAAIFYRFPEESPPPSPDPSAEAATQQQTSHSFTEEPSPPPPDPSAETAIQRRSSHPSVEAAAAQQQPLWVSEAASILQQPEAATQQQSLWASPELLWLSLMALLCVRPERWMEAALVGDVLERQRVSFLRVSGRESASRG